MKVYYSSFKYKISDSDRSIIFMSYNTFISTTDRKSPFLRSNVLVDLNGIHMLTCTVRLQHQSPITKKIEKYVF